MYICVFMQRNVTKKPIEIDIKYTVYANKFPCTQLDI
jgi:hypothetical protein